MINKSIAFLIDNFSIRAGFIKQVIEQANYFSNYGYDVTVFCSNYDKKRCFPEIKKNFKIKSIEYKSKNKFFLPIENRFSKKNMMEKLVLSKKENFNVFIVHGDPYYMLSKFLKSKFPDSKIVWHVNDLPYSYDVLLQKNPPLMFKLAGFLIRFIDKIYISEFESITTLNNTNKLLIKKFFDKDSAVVYTGVDKFFLQNKKKEINGKKKIMILSVGAFAVNRRYEDIIKSIKKLNDESSLPKYYLRIVGYQNSAPEYYKKLLSLTKNLNLEEFVSFPGSPTNVELKKEYANADIFVQSTEHIGWTIPAMEAMISGLPVIITNSCGLNECLKDGNDSFIVNSRSPHEILKKIRKLTEDKKLYEKMRVNGKVKIKKNFMWDNYCLRYKNYTESLN